MSAESIELTHAFDAITKAASPDDWARHLPNCGYTDEVPECGCAEWGGRVHAALRSALAQAWHEGAVTALDFAVRGDDGICLSLDRAAHPNPYGVRTTPAGGESDG